LDASGWLLLHADGIARQEQSGFHGKRLGIVQAYAEFSTITGAFARGVLAAHVAREHRIRSGLEIHDHLLALNSWIAQEVRPIGADLQWSPGFYVTVGAHGFPRQRHDGNATRRPRLDLRKLLTTYDENMPLPYPETTKPIGADLDHKNGYSERIRLSLPERAMIQFAHIDNRAPITPNPIKGQTPWQTHFM